MLSSSDAKWRCLWHLLVWSLLLMLLIFSKILMTEYIVLMLLACMSFIVLPIITALYSNTSGKHGAGLLRVGYVVCDPVLACITVMPIMLINHLPNVIQKYNCLKEDVTRNETSVCFINISDHRANSSTMEAYLSYKHNENRFRNDLDLELMVIECSVVVPILLSLCMGKRTRKMSYYTYVIVFVYWFIAALEVASVLEVAKCNASYEHVICTVSSMVVIVMILTNSYGIVTLCSYIIPGTHTAKKAIKKYDLLYSMCIAIAGILFAELPLFIAKVHIMLDSEGRNVLSGSFFIWMIKDIVFTGLIIFMVIIKKFVKRYHVTSCHPLFYSDNVFFKPEKRDYYIHQNMIQCPDTLVNSECALDVTDSPEAKPSKKTVRFQI